MNRILAIITTFLLLFTSFAFANSTVYKSEYTIVIDEQPIELDVQPQVVDGKLMVPLRNTLEKMGFQIIWNSEEESVEIIKDASFTKVYIGENSYFKHKMAPFNLSTNPIILNGRTLLPLEFFHEVLDLYFQVEGSQILFYPNEDDETLVTHTGYVSKIKETDRSVQYHISRNEGEEVYLIIHATEETVFQNSVEEGDYLKTVSPPIMLMSYPGQTGAIIIY